MEIERLVADFKACVLPKAEWTHQAHLIVGFWHVAQYGREAATPLMRDGIRRYNDAVGTANTDTSGYHETTTLFYLEFIDLFLQQADQGKSLAELVNAFLSAYSDRELPLRYFSRELLMSVRARRTWVEPDLQSL
ncbi:MAG: hypothetical protein ACKV2V_17585 [Blastocatellia bacterium]